MRVKQRMNKYKQTFIANLDRTLLLPRANTVTQSAVQHCHQDLTFYDRFLLLPKPDLLYSTVCICMA